MSANPSPSPSPSLALAPSPSPSPRKRPLLRPWLRALHRDLGYLAVGLTFVYAFSGLAVNHIADWDPNFHNTSRIVELGPLAGDDDAIATQVTSKLAIDEKPNEVYREGNELEILFKRRTLHVDVATGHVLDEEQKPRLLLRVANWLHLNRGKKAWTYFADTYAAGLLVLATSGLFMIPGRKGLLGRGAVLVTLGILAPVLYVTLSHGP
ncbi:MAG TPA: PepSY-associated TM helix domain-containing protein [Polyangiaceae bacterium]|nr:PepSY-associated TM helix domain-containing protein [Polyangiaceae bacterium]